MAPPGVRQWRGKNGSCFVLEELQTGVKGTNNFGPVSDDSCQMTSDVLWKNKGSHPCLGKALDITVGCGIVRS